MAENKRIRDYCRPLIIFLTSLDGESHTHFDFEMLALEQLYYDD